MLLGRLKTAYNVITKAYDSNNSSELGKLAKRLQPLYSECMNCDKNSKEFHFAEYLRLLIMLHFELLFDEGGNSYDLYENCQVEAWKAGLVPNRITGKFVDE